MKLDRVGHFTRISVAVAGEPSRFLFDTGIGVNVVSPELADRQGMAPVGQVFAGQRMSGQWVEAPLVHLPPTAVDGHVLRDQVAAVVDLDPPVGDGGFSGILGLSAFDHVPVTVDPSAETLTLGDAGPARSCVPLEIERRGPSTSAHVELVLPAGQSVSVELDTGSGCLILDTAYLDRGDVTVLDGVEMIEGVDETGYAWVRQIGRLEGEIHLAAARQAVQSQPRVLFQDVIHDGLIGADYLDRFRYTIDVDRKELRLTPLNS